MFLMRHLARLQKLKLTIFLSFANQVHFCDEYKSPATSAGSLFLCRLRGLVVIESLDPLEDVRLPPAPGAFRDVKRLREVTICRVRLLPDGTHSDTEHGRNLGVRKQQLRGSRERHFVFSACSHFLPYQSKQIQPKLDAGANHPER